MTKQHLRVKINQLVKWTLNPLKRLQITQPTVMAYEVLKKSIQETGIIMNLAVVATVGGKYLVIDGNRRLKIALELGIKEVDVTLYSGIDPVLLAVILNTTGKPWDQQTLGQLIAGTPDNITDIPKAFSNKLIRMINVFGQDYPEFIENYTIAAFDYGMKVAKYLGRKDDEAFCKKACLWVGKHRMARKIRILLELGAQPAEIEKAINRDVPLSVVAG